MSVTVEVDISRLEECFTDENIGKAAAAYAESVGSDSNMYVPFDTGSLHGSMHVVEADGGYSVEWPMAYAQAVYHMDDGSTHWTQRGYTQPHSHWFEWAKAEHGDDWARVLTNALLKPLGRSFL